MEHNSVQILKTFFALTLFVLMFRFFLGRSHGMRGVAVKDALSLSADSVDRLSTCPQSPQSCCAYRKNLGFHC